MTDQPVQSGPSPLTLQLLQTYWNVDTIMAEWAKTEAQLAEIKLKEMALRKAIFELKFPNLKEGTERVPLANGYHLKAVGKLNYNLDKDTTEAALDEISKYGEKAAFVADRLVKWEPTLSVSEYRKLEGDLAPYKAMIDKVLTIKPGAPTLEIEPPKTNP